MTSTPGQEAYVGAMVTGLALIILLAVQLILSYAMRRRPPTSSSPTLQRSHRMLGVVLIGLVLVHPLTYVVAVYRRAGSHAPQAIARAMTDGSHYGNSLLLGLAGVLIIVLLAGAQALRRQPLRAHGWVRLGLFLGSVHALRIGSHVRDGIGGLFLRGILAVIIAEAVVRLWTTRGRAWPFDREVSTADPSR